MSPSVVASSPNLSRLRLHVRGAVQGVGFRPLVYRLAHERDLAGWVENTTEGLTIEIEGTPAGIEAFRADLADKPPRRAIIQSIVAEPAPVEGRDGFAIRESERRGAPSALVLPDIATCAACRREVFDPTDRRFRYPFTNCTDCGPRYSVIIGLPYDRERTAMKGFAMCAACRAEYRDPGDRRFHAEPVACPDCGPCLELWDEQGHPQLRGDEALLAAAGAIGTGRIVAVKGLGGFHLVVDAGNDDAVQELRRRKRREAKPFAVMVSGLRQARLHAVLSDLEARLLASPEAPIVLVERRGSLLSPAVAPRNPCLGLLLPYTPLHHLLMESVRRPVVATSGNLTDEPICTDEREALERLRGIADLFLVHDRPIARYVDDSVVRVIGGRPLVMRRARGYAPLPVAFTGTDRVFLAVGAHVKNAIALGHAGQVIVSPHIGDLGTAPALEGFRKTIDTFEQLYERSNVTIACDLHPDYSSTQWARRKDPLAIAVQHHYAHVLAGMADNGLAPPVTGIAWDGSGYGLDGTVWGGEVLRVGERGFERRAWLRPFPLPGGEKAVKEPRRSALGVLWAVHGEAALELEEPVLGAFTGKERGLLRQMLARGVNCPLTSSAGRLFDAVAAMLGLHPLAQFEGQAAMALEFAAQGVAEDGAYPFEMRDHADGLVLGWEPMVAEVQAEIRRSAAPGRVAARFHNTLAEMILASARHVGEARVVLTGGCFQNRYLTERAISRLRAGGFEPCWHRRIPPNDGGIAVGQVLAAAREVGGVFTGASEGRRVSCA
jgi:hydrogenase maturation protein HypF